MVQFNLLPDIKIQYIKARRQKRMVMLISTIVTITGISLLVIFGVIVFGVQKKSVNDLNNDISAASQQLQSTEDLTKILTVQNQLNALPGLHDEKPVASRLFTYISQVTPVSASIGRLNVDFAQNTISISGSADSLETINKFTDTLKFTMYEVRGSDEEKNAFSDVVLSSFGRDDAGANYTIVSSFDPTIFSELQEVTLTVPNIITTRSKTEQPGALFRQTEGQQ